MQILKGCVTKGEVKDQQASSKTRRLTGPGEPFSFLLHLLNKNACLQKKTESPINETMHTHRCVCVVGRPSAKTQFSLYWKQI